MTGWLKGELQAEIEYSAVEGGGSCWKELKEERLNLDFAVEQFGSKNTLKFPSYQTRG